MILGIKRIMLLGYILSFGIAQAAPPKFGGYARWPGADYHPDFKFSELAKDHPDYGKFKIELDNAQRFWKGIVGESDQYQALFGESKAYKTRAGSLKDKDAAIQKALEKGDLKSYVRLVNERDKILLDILMEYQAKEAKEGERVVVVRDGKETKTGWMVEASLTTNLKDALSSQAKTETVTTNHDGTSREARFPSFSSVALEKAKFDADVAEAMKGFEGSGLDAQVKAEISSWAKMRGNEEVADRGARQKQTIQLIHDLAEMTRTKDPLLKRVLGDITSGLMEGDAKPTDLISVAANLGRANTSLGKLGVLGYARLLGMKRKITSALVIEALREQGENMGEMRKLTLAERVQKLSDTNRKKIFGTEDGTGGMVAVKMAEYVAGGEKFRRAVGGFVNEKGEVVHDTGMTHEREARNFEAWVKAGDLRDPKNKEHIAEFVAKNPDFKDRLEKIEDIRKRVKEDEGLLRMICDPKSNCGKTLGIDCRYMMAA